MVGRVVSCDSNARVRGGTPLPQVGSGVSLNYNILSWSFVAHSFYVINHPHKTPNECSTSRNKLNKTALIMNASRKARFLSIFVFSVMYLKRTFIDTNRPPSMSATDKNRPIIAKLQFKY
jgi:hypothetical protein